MAILFVLCLAIKNKENLPNSIYELNPQNFAKVVEFRQIWSHCLKGLILYTINFDNSFHPNIDPLVMFIDIAQSMI